MIPRRASYLAGLELGDIEEAADPAKNPCNSTTSSCCNSSMLSSDSGIGLNLARELGDCSGSSSSYARRSLVVSTVLVFTAFTRSSLGLFCIVGIRVLVKSSSRGSSFQVDLQTGQSRIRFFPTRAVMQGKWNVWEHSAVKIAEPCPAFTL
ncbi:hypothetical protein SAY86_027296 [Trapa natans]|uniref:Uncharacterized protein n=1 Tax=Trapa natans TaxID=22666 RepID=A0AAN7KTK6_TRANT|nr:hypothetical protein SAY86_027296 [Trapa natans]